MSYTYDFNVIVDRSRERSKTWDPRNVKPGQLPMNGAEMHFACPIPVLEAVREVSECQVYGYPYFTDDFAQAAAGWMKRRHDWDVDYKWVEFVGGIVPGIAFAMQAMTKVGDGIIINTPAYSPFRDCIRDNDRKLVESGLLIDSERAQWNLTGPTWKRSLPTPTIPASSCVTRRTPPARAARWRS